jgi:hypothetical protein
MELQNHPESAALRAAACQVELMEVDQPSADIERPAFSGHRSAFDETGHASPLSQFSKLARQRQSVAGRAHNGFRATVAVTVPLLPLTITQSLSLVNTNFIAESLRSKAET